MDWIALASVVSSAVVAILTLVINALTKRGDRKHAASLDFEKRVWETKSGALLNLITKCESIRSAIRLTEVRGAESQRTAVYGVFDGNHFRLTSAELTAYAAGSVNAPVEQLHSLMQQANRTLAGIFFARLQEIRKAEEEALENADFEAAGNLHDDEVETEKEVGQKSGIDVAAVDVLCSRIIGQARKDLRMAARIRRAPAPVSRFMRAVARRGRRG
jgi:hypothetical protein